MQKKSFPHYLSSAAFGAPSTRRLHLAQQQDVQAESPYSSSLSSSLLINQRHSVLRGLLGLFCYVFPSISSLWQSVVSYFFVFNESPAFFMRRNLIHPIHFPVSLLVIFEMALKAFMLSDNLNRNVLIYPEPDAGLSPQNWHQWTSAEHNYHPECVVS